MCFVGFLNMFSEDRGLLVSVNFVMVYDGFIFYDFVLYDVKYNEVNGEYNCDGVDMNCVFNYGIEGLIDDFVIFVVWCKVMCNFFGILLFFVGIFMFIVGDEVGWIQKGNNNVYVQDLVFIWFVWDFELWQEDLCVYVVCLICFCEENLVLCLICYVWLGEYIFGVFVMDWYDQNGEMMEVYQWIDFGNCMF